MDYNLISADNHILEPPETYIERVPKNLRDQAPRIMRGSDGGDGWSLDGTPPKQTFGLDAVGAIAGQNYDEYRNKGIRWEEVLPGNYEGAAHIKDNQADGVDAAAIYCSMWTKNIYYDLTDRNLALHCVRAYNDWLIDDFCSTDPDRLFSLPILPVNDGVPAAVAEAERVIAKGGRGLFLPLSDVPYHDPQYDPLWKVAVDAGVPVTIHRTGVSRQETAAKTASNSSIPGLYVAESTVQRFFSAVGPISNLIFTGLFDRFPALVFVAAEVNCSWLPALAQQMDQSYERQQKWAELTFNAVPSSYLGKNVFVTIVDDFLGYKLANDDSVLASAAMFSSDYPHSQTLWPRSKEYIAEMTMGMSEDTKNQILFINAARVYSLPD